MSLTYRTPGGDEQWSRFGVNHPIQAIIIAPLFEEYNRCRRLLAEVMRGLDRSGIGTVLADLPGTGESLRSLSDITLADWRGAVRAVGDAIKPTLVASFRGGALIDAGVAVKGWWRCAPETGQRIVRDLKRTQLVGNSGDAALYAGHPLTDAFLTELEATIPASLTPLRTVRLISDQADADAKLPGTPLWRRAEPDDDPVLAAAIVTDLSRWAKQCAAS